MENSIFTLKNLNPKAQKIMKKLSAMNEEPAKDAHKLNYALCLCRTPLGACAVQQARRWRSAGGRGGGAVGGPPAPTPSAQPATAAATSADLSYT